MEPQQYTPTPQTNTTPIPPMMPQKKSSPVGSIIGAIIVIIILIFGGLYFWGAQLEKEQAMTDDQLPFIPATQSNDNATVATESDQVSDIEADMTASDPSVFTSDTSEDMKSIENQL